MAVIPVVEIKEFTGKIDYTVLNGCLNEPVDVIVMEFFTCK